MKTKRTILKENLLHIFKEACEHFDVNFVNYMISDLEIQDVTCFAMMMHKKTGAKIYINEAYYDEKTYDVLQWTIGIG